MNLVILRIVGILLVLFSLTHLPPLLVSLYYGEDAHSPFLSAFALTLLTGLLFWFPAFDVRRELRVRDCFLVVTLFWTVLGAFGSIPFMLLVETDLSLTDALFESISGLTTTGATVLTGLDE